MGKCPWLQRGMTLLRSNPGYQTYTHANAGHISQECTVGREHCWKTDCHILLPVRIFRDIFLLLSPLPFPESSSQCAPHSSCSPHRGELMQGTEQNWGSLACVLKAYALCTKNKRRFKVHFLHVFTRIIKESGFLPGQKKRVLLRVWGQQVQTITFRIDKQGLPWQSSG